MTIKPLTSADTEATSGLVQQNIEAYGMDDFSEQGYEKFKATVLDEGMTRNMKGDYVYWGALDGDHIIGMIAFKKPAHLYNLFVHPEYHHQGIARKLWEHALTQLQPEAVTVFSSTYARGVYEKLGFVPNGGKIDNQDIICFPMIWKKPPVEQS